jgi:hypothetical protein
LATIREITSDKALPNYSIVLSTKDKLLFDGEQDLSPESYQLKTSGKRL